VNGIFAFIFVFTIVGAFVLIPRAIRHDQLSRELEEIDYYTLPDDDDAAWREGES
jgi:hypothetical protein